MDIDSLIQQAEEALEAGDDHTAIAAGERLLEMRNAFGFQILARAYWQRDEKTKAIRTLQDGVAKAPNMFPLWQLLGDYWSDVGDVKRARESYEKILSIASSDAVSRAHALSELDRHDEAISTARRALADDPDAEDEEKSRLLYSIAYALWSKGDRDSALRAAWESAALHPSNEDAMWLIREIEDRRSKGAVHFRMVIEGAIRKRRFVVTCEVVADDEEEAKDLARRFEPEALRDKLLFDEIERLASAPDLPKGVYSRSDYMFERRGKRT
jgi:tetratricopeptide (TPR) repeat protein